VSTRCRAALALGILILVALASDSARAHGLSPVLLEVVARVDGTASVLWKTAPSLPRGADIAPVLPRSCRPLGAPSEADTGEGLVRRWEVDCGPAGLEGSVIGVRDLDVARTDALLRLGLPDGRMIETVLRGDRPDFVVPGPRTREAAFARGLRSGLDRLRDRFDALPAVLGLVLLARDARSLVAAVAAFVLANSALLLAAGLGAIDPRPALAGFLGAASVVAVAAEVAREDPRTPARSRPWIPAALLGAVHGLSLAPVPLAGANGEAPGPIALLAHHLGIEAVLLAIATSFGFAWLGAPGAPGREGNEARARRLGRALAYPIGCVAAFLAFERASRLLP